MRCYVYDQMKYNQQLLHYTKTVYSSIIWSEIIPNIKYQIVCRKIFLKWSFFTTNNHSDQQ